MAFKPVTKIKVVIKRIEKVEVKVDKEDSTDYLLIYNLAKV